MQSFLAFYESYGDTLMVISIIVIVVMIGLMVAIYRLLSIIGKVDEDADELPPKADEPSPKVAAISKFLGRFLGFMIIVPGVLSLVFFIFHPAISETRAPFHMAVLVVFVCTAFALTVKVVFMICCCIGGVVQFVAQKIKYKRGKQL